MCPAESDGSSPAITESPVTNELLQNIKSCANEARENLGLEVTAAPSQLVAAVDAEVLRFQREGGEPPSDLFDEGPLHMGSLWGEQLVNTLSWEWVKFTFHEHGNSQAIGVVSPDRSLMICPFHFVFGCMINNATVTIELSYNFMKEFDSPDARSRTIGEQPPPGAYVNVMERVHHMLPPG